MTVGRTDHGRQRHPGRQRLGGGDHVGDDAGVIDGPERCRSCPIPDWISSETRRMPCSSANLAQALQPAERRRHEAAFALHRLDEDCRDVGGVDLGHEALFEEAQMPIDERVL